jgi:hypothetical protein
MCLTLVWVSGTVTFSFSLLVVPKLNQRECKRSIGQMFYRLLGRKSRARNDRTFQQRARNNPVNVNMPAKTRDLSVVRNIPKYLPRLSYTTVNLLKTERRLLYLKAQSVPRSKHFSSRL